MVLPAGEAKGWLRPPFFVTDAVIDVCREVASLRSQ
jgi:hypothetical protein